MVEEGREWREKHTNTLVYNALIGDMEAFLILQQCFVWIGFIKQAQREISESKPDFMKWLLLMCG